MDTVARYNLSYREGYFMSQEDEKAVKQDVLLNYAETKKVLATLREQAHQFGERFEGLGVMLKTDNRITNIAVEVYQPFLSQESHEKLVNLKADIRKAESEIGRLATRMRQLGFGDMVSS